MKTLCRKEGGERRNSFQTSSLQLTVLHVRHCSGLPAGEVAVEGLGLSKHCEKECGERRNSFQTSSLQLTAIHGRHCSGLPVQGLVEDSGPLKHWKKVVREETVFKHITTTYCIACSSLLRSPRWRCLG